MPRSFKRVFNYKCFNPRTHEGYDISIYLLTLLSSRFNPRTHEGYDHDFFTNEKLPFNSFNPRTREGYDINQTRLSEIDTILIPVPMKGTIPVYTLF